jgi:hypothetical protein
MPLNIWNGSSWNPFKKIKLHDGITWNDAKRIFIYDGTTWKPVTEVTPINKVLPIISLQPDNYLYGAQETISVSTGTWDNSPTSYRYQWQKAPYSGSSLNWSDINGKTENSLFLNEDEWNSSRTLKYVGYVVRCKVTATNQYGDNREPVYTLPTPIIAPQKLTNLTVTVVENGVVKIDWVKPIGANDFYLQYQGPEVSFTQVPSLGDVNTYTFDTGNADGTIGLLINPLNTSNVSGMTVTGYGKNGSVNDLKPNKPSVTTTMTGANMSGATLNWSLNLIQPTSWIIYNNGVSYAGSFMNGGPNVTSYTIQEVGVGGASFGSFTITINGTAPRFDETSWSSSPGLAINYPAVPKPVNTVAPTVSTSNGRVFSATTGTWTNTSSIYSYLYEWFADGSPIDNIFIYESDTINLYDTTAYDNKAISCTVQLLLTDLTLTTPVASSNSAQSVVKPPTVIAPTWAGGSPVISGSNRDWSVSSVGTWNNNPTSYSYQWQYNDQGSVWINIGTGSSITTPSYLDGFSIKCIVTASNSAGSATATSNSRVPSAPAPVATWGACTQYNNGTDYGYDCTGTTKMTWSRPIYGYREQYYLNGVAQGIYRDCTGSPTYGDKTYQATVYWTWNSADCGYVEPIAIEYYIGTSWCNANSGAYISAPSAAGPYTASSMPADVLTGASNSREKIVYRSTYAAALAAAAQAACATVAFSPPHFPPFFPPYFGGFPYFAFTPPHFPPFFPPHFPPFFPPFFPPHFPPFFPPHFPPFFPPYFSGFPYFAFTPPHFPPFFPPHFAVSPPRFGFRY